jgi:hypothetical protein
VSPADGAQTLVPDSAELVFPRDVEVEASGAVLVAEEAGMHQVRVDPTTGARADVGPPLDLIQGGEEPQGFGGFSALALGLDGTPYLSLVAQSAPSDYALFRAPTDAADAVRVSELPLCRGADLEVVRALPVPEPGAAFGACTALATLGFVRARRRG